MSVGGNRRKLFSATFRNKAKIFNMANFLYFSISYILIGINLILFCISILSILFPQKENKLSEKIKFFFVGLGISLIFPILSLILKDFPFFNTLNSSFDNFYIFISNYPLWAVLYLLFFVFSTIFAVILPVFPIKNFPKNKSDWDYILKQCGGSKYKFINGLGLFFVSTLYIATFLMFIFWSYKSFFVIITGANFKP